MAAGAQSIDMFFGAAQTLAIGGARPLGVTLVFTAFTWGGIATGPIRAVFALALALPVVFPFWSNPMTMMETFDASFVLVLMKEVALGAMIGFLLGLPLEALGAAGAIVDAYQGGGVITSAAGETTPLGQLFSCIGLWMFAALGGFWSLSEALYASYTLWPLEKFAPTIDAQAPGLVLTLVGRMFVVAATLAGPLLIVLLLVDITVLISARLGKRVNLLALSPMLRTIAIVTLLPLFAYALVRAMGSQSLVILDPRVISAWMGG